jgi:hypothetical protein
VLNWLRRIDWLAINTSALILCLALLIIGQIKNEPQQEVSQSASYGPKSDIDPRSPDERVADYTLWLERFTGLLALVSFMQGIFLYRADKSARVSADAATKAVNVASDNAKKQFRAYVYVSGAKVQNLDKENDRYVIVEIKNFGQIPAYDKRFWGGVHVREWPLASVLREAPEETRMGNEALPPGRLSILRVPVGELSEWEERELREGRAGVYLWGRVTYRDAFGDSHFTNLRFVCEGEGLASGFLHATEEGNESD